MKFMRGLLLFFFAAGSGLSVHADHLPLWELGVGGGMINAPDYRGAKSYTVFASPFPYGRYRGDKFRVDDGGIRQKLFDTDRLKLDVSLAGNIPVKNENNLREGMPELDPLGEIGPSLHYRLWPQVRDINHSLWLINPLRAVISSDFSSFQYQGWTYAPYVEYYQRWRPSRRVYTLSLAAGPMWASQEYHQYFYEVLPQQVTPTRSAYSAEAGYSGSRMTVSFSGISRRAWIALYMRYDNLRGATFADSPLVETNNYFIGGVVIGWLFVGSDVRASHER